MLTYKLLEQVQEAVFKKEETLADVTSGFLGGVSPRQDLNSYEMGPQSEGIPVLS